MPPPPQRENLFANLGFNLLLPVLILNKGSKWLPSLDPALIMVLALLFPVGYFIYDYQKRKKRNLLSILGAVGVLLTGGISLMKLDPMVFAIKETLMPLLIGIFVVASTKTKNPLIHALLYNPELFDTEKINSHLDTPAKQSTMDKLMLRSTWIIAASFLVSAALNFFLTRMIVKTDPLIDQAAYNAEVGTQYWVSIVVISACTLPISIYAMWTLFKGIEGLTGLKLEECMHAQENDKDKVES
ncbi:VC0807 family protein [Cerasicoccus maritimus]|uniref:VC0807 family protein n=1 Tax=Cerasicoccus maritimus TaxID=490089 RepID=UPI00285283BF|nr:VC0807 family protein [Cerasicoccus maritimus]